MSGLMACAQCMSPHTAAFGLYWKNMWYMPFQKIGPLGSFIQFLAGSRWNCGRSGSAARRACKESSAKNRNAERRKGENAAKEPETPAAFKNARREEPRKHLPTARLMRLQIP